MDKNETEIRKRKLAGENLQGLTTHPGWPALISLFEDEYMSAHKKLIAGEDPDARATMAVIEKILERTDTNIDWGKAAASKLVELLKRQ